MSKTRPNYEGISSIPTCPDACRLGHCIITGDEICGHPHGAGLQSKHMMSPPTLRRFAEAKGEIKRQDTDRAIARELGRHADG